MEGNKSGGRYSAIKLYRLNDRRSSENFSAQFCG
jgi:hypothetical protein